MLKLKYILPVIVIFVSIWYISPNIENKNYNFTLQGIDGKVQLSDFKHKNIIIYFGYLNCPDVCPTTLSTINNALDKLSIQEKNSIQVIFVSIDPDRDKPKEIDSYVKYFISSAIGLTGTKENLDKLRGIYGVYYVKEKSSSVMEYTMSHTSNLYFFKTRNRFFKKISEYNNENKIYTTIQKML